MHEKKQKKGVASRVNAVITHVMADGTQRDSVNGYEIPYNENTHHLYWNAARTMRELETERLRAKEKENS